MKHNSPYGVRVGAKGWQKTLHDRTVCAGFETATIEPSEELIRCGIPRLAQALSVGCRVELFHPRHSDGRIPTSIGSPPDEARLPRGEGLRKPRDHYTRCCERLTLFLSSHPVRIPVGTAITWCYCARVAYRLQRYGCLPVQISSILARASACGKTRRPDQRDRMPFQLGVGGSKRSGGCRCLRPTTTVPKSHGSPEGGGTGRGMDVTNRLEYLVGGRR